MYLMDFQAFDGTFVWYFDDAKKVAEDTVERVMQQIQSGEIWNHLDGYEIERSNRTKDKPILLKITLYDDEVIIASAIHYAYRVKTLWDIALDNL